jgi:hypothetical protein
MKIIVKISLVIILFAIVSCKPSPQKAQEYYKDISKPIASVLTREDELIKVINANMKKDSAKSITDKKTPDETELSVSIKALDMAFSNFQLQIATSLNQMKAIGMFDDKSTLHDAAMEMLNEYKAVSEKEYPALVDVVKIPDFKYSNNDDTRFLDLSDSIDNKLQRKISVYIQQVKLFSQEYNFQLEKDSLK